ncbi:hypothetical protein AURDEDRAFT_179733 [Auricularia subglabra TFB-10046 SS5]|nr:hypothetical protein AURDEDRAFT_179733 [Auricularia subglabra TFB-10046 SS5]
MPAPAPPYIVERVEALDVLQEELDLRIEVYADHSYISGLDEISIDEGRFVKEQGFALELEKDEHDQLETATHFVLRLQQNPERPVVGTVRVHRYAEKAYKIGRICVRADCRKYGFGSVLIARAEEWAIADACKAYPSVQSVRALIEAQEQAMPFYNRCGYEGEGELFFDEVSAELVMTGDERRVVLNLILQGVPHRKMFKQLQI